MTTIKLIIVPYDSGHRGERMGAGPQYFLSQNIDEILRKEGWTITVETVEAQRPFRAEIATAAAFTAYDPSCDPEGKIFRAGTQLMKHMVQQLETTI